MLSKPRILRLVALFLVIQAALICGPAPPASAAHPAVGIFYEPLSAYGNWINYGNYGPCWYPNGVGADWRPYLNGRWVPTAAGWVFETNEPWGWAGYHYGNWMPTAEYGWIWYPGSTWYPSTCAWRSSQQYYGWAPIPPPGYGSLGDPFWIFVEAASFLLGFGQPFAPSYSYYDCGCLAPVNYVPTLFPQTALLTDFYAPAFAPRAYYSFGPPFASVARVTNINVVQINNFVKNVNIVNVQNVVPPQAVVQRHPVVRQVVPAPVLEGRRFNVKRASVGLGQVSRPNALPPPRNIPSIKAEIPKATVKRPVPGAVGKGMALPQKAVKSEVPGMKPAPGAPAPKPEVKPAPAHPAAPAKPEVRPAPPMEHRAPPAEHRAPPSGEFRPPPAPAHKPPAEVKPTPPAPAHPVRPEVRPTPPMEHRAPPPSEVRPAPAPPRPVTPPPAQAPREMRPAPAPAPPMREMRPAPAPAPAPPAMHPAPAPAPAPHAAPAPPAPHPPAAPAPHPPGAPGPKEEK